MPALLPKYNHYQQTNYDWLCQVPEHWLALSIRALASLKNARNGSRKDLELLSVYREYGVIKKTSRDDNHNVESENLSNYKHVQIGDLVLNKMKVWQGSLGVSKYEGIVSPAYIVCSVSSDLNRNYLNYLLRAAIYKTIYNRLSYGVRVGQWDIRYDDFKSIPVYLPPKEEQDQIVRYLDSKQARINKFIKNKKRLIELLKEQKQAVINQAVTKGLDPNAKMKPSGVDWLGDVPEGWEVVRAGRIYNIELGKMLQPEKKSKEDTLENYLCAMNVNWGKFNLETVKKMWFSEKDKQKYLIKAGDLIVVEGGDVGVSCIWDGSITPCYIQNAVHRVREMGLGHNRYLYYWLFCLKKKGVIDSLCSKATFAHLTKEKLERLIVVLPSPHEQLQIIRFLDSQNEIVDQTITRITKEIDLITEYRTALISAVVTGQVDVRHIKVDDLPEAEEELTGLAEEPFAEDDYAESEVV